MSEPRDYPTVASCTLLELPRIEDARGNLTFFESGQHMPFTIRRAYWIYDVPGGAVRGGHAYETLQELMIALSGSFDVTVDDGVARKTITLNRSYHALYVPNMIWRQLGNFSTNAVCLIAASAAYEERDYVRDHHAFLQARGAPGGVSE